MAPTDDTDPDAGETDGEPSGPSPADAASVRGDVLDAVVGFARDLRTAGASVPANAAVDATAALSETGWTEKAVVRAAMRATLVSRREDIEVFDRLFEDFWSELRAAGSEPPEVLDALADAAKPLGSGVPAPADADETDSERDCEEDEPDESTDSATRSAAVADDESIGSSGVETARYSPVGDSEPVSRAVALDRLSLAGPVDRLTRAIATRPGRRRTRATSGRFVDARRALRASFQTGGVVAEVPEADRRESAVRGVVLVDVSRSVLDSIDREFLLEWLRLLVDRWRSARVFFFDTDVREVTASFDERTVDDVGDALARAEASWGGGTRIGHALATLRESHSDAVDRRTAVLTVSDGLERGDVETLESSAAWLGRRARLVLWLNPLAASPAYEPVARGMAAALPAVDGLFAFAGPADVTELVRQLERRDRRRLGYEYDPRRAASSDRGQQTDRAEPTTGQ